MSFYEWYQLNHVYFVDEDGGVVISEVKKDVLWRLYLTSEENLECFAHLRKVEDLTHTNWIPIFDTKLKLQKNSVLQLEVDGWANE